MPQNTPKYGYKLLFGSHSCEDENGVRQIYTRGAVVPISDTTREAFKHKFGETKLPLTVNVGGSEPESTPPKDESPSPDSETDDPSDEGDDAGEKGSNKTTPLAAKTSEGSTQKGAPEAKAKK